MTTIDIIAAMFFAFNSNSLPTTPSVVAAPTTIQAPAEVTATDANVCPYTWTWYPKTGGICSCTFYCDGTAECYCTGQTQPRPDPDHPPTCLRLADRDDEKAEITVVPAVKAPCAVKE